MTRSASALGMDDRRGSVAITVLAATAIAISSPRNDHGIGRRPGNDHRKSTQQVASTVVSIEHGVRQPVSTMLPPASTVTPRYATIATSRIAIEKNRRL